MSSNTKRNEVASQMSDEEKKRQEMNKLIEQGNPTDLMGAVIRGVNMTRIKVGVHFSYPLVVFQEQELSVRDYLAQKFTPALLEAEAADNAEVAEALRVLWERITGRTLG